MNLIKQIYTLISISLIILLLSCSTNNIISIKGKVDKIKYFSIVNANYDYMRSNVPYIKVDIAKDGSIDYQSDSIEEGYYAINSHNTIWYLRPGLDIEFTEKNKKLVEISNDFQNNISKKENNSKKVDILNSCRKTSFADHCKKVDKYYAPYFSYVEKITDSRFKEIEKYHLDMSILMFKLEHRLYYSNNYKYQKEFFKLFKQLRFDRPYYTMFFEWRKWLKSYFYMIRVNNNYTKEQMDDLEFQLSKIDNIEIKKAWAWERISYLGAYDDNSYKDLKIAQKIITNKSHLEFLKNELTKVEKCIKGKPAYNFEFKNLNGENIKLSDLKGNYVYIDCWGVHCPACFMEMPHLKSIEEKFHGKNIKFVSLCLTNDIKRWKKLVKDFNTGGIQLLGKKSRGMSDFYNIRYIPRFILIDKKGNIVNASAARPSNKNLETILNNLLNK